MNANNHSVLQELMPALDINHWFTVSNFLSDLFLNVNRRIDENRDNGNVGENVSLELFRTMLWELANIADEAWYNGTKKHRIPLPQEAQDVFDEGLIPWY